MPPQPTQTAPTTQLDPQVVALAQAIRQTESGNNPTQVGKSGEYGAYQWLPSTWAAQSQAAGVNVPLQQATPEQQNEVAYKTLANWKSQGYNVGQIASMWNAGEGAPNAYLDNNVGTNAEGVAYNTPAYAQKVAQTYQQIKAQQGGQQYNAASGGGNVQLNAPDLPSPQDPNQPSIPTGQNLPPLNGYAPPTPPAQSAAPASTDTNTDPGFLSDVTSGNVGGALIDAGNFIAPAVADTYHDIKGDSTKTGLQQAGDWGSTLLSALALIPGLEPEALAAKAGLVGEEGLGVAGRIAANSALGAGFGATNALGAGETDPGQIAQSGLLGAGAGGALGAAGEALGGVLGKYASEDTESRLADQTNRLKTLQKSAAENSRPATQIAGATNPATTLLTKVGDDGKPLSSLLKVTDGKVDASAITNPERTGSLDNLIEQHSSDATNLVKSMQGGVPLADFRTMAENEIKNDPTIRGTLSVPKALATLDSKLTSAQMSYGDTLPYTAVDEIRAGMNKVYDPNERDVAKIIGDTSRKILYNGSGTNDALRSTMGSEAELIRARNFVQKLQGTTVKGGRLGKYSARMLGGLAGGLVGKIGGPIGEGAGALAGGTVGNYLEDLAQRSYFDPLTSKIARVASPTLKTAGNLAKVGLLRSVR